nr:retrovirus-related Pol polyprotein from transposon TNT 1-94 [Tanacetum cinerariifolium]
MHDTNPDHPMVTRSKAGIYKSKHFADFSLLSYSALHQALFSSKEPKGFESPAKDLKWYVAMCDEMAALKQNGTWDLVPQPPRSNVVGWKWVFRTEFHADNTIDKFKARLVAQGFTQVLGLEYSATFSPVVKASTVRIILSLVVLNKWPLHQLDVKNAILDGNLTDIVYMEQPPGFIDSRVPNHVCRLKKALYGLKQAPRVWFQCLSSFLVGLGFSYSRADTSLFIFKKDSSILDLLVYVDDIILTWNQPSLIRHFITRLNTEFSINDLEMLRRKVKEIEAYNASNVRTTIKEKKNRKATTRKERRARCYICKKRGHVFWKCQNKGNTATPGTPTVENKTREPIMVEDEEVFKYPEDVHVKTNYMVEGTDFSNWNNIWYVSNAYKKHMSPTKSLFKRLKSRFRKEQTQHEKKFIFSHGIGEAVVETNENEIVIPCVLYTPEVTLNVLSLDQLLAQCFVITYGHDKCRISYMFGEDKKIYYGESDYGKGKGRDVKTESMIAKQNKYLEEYFDLIDPKDACPLIKGLKELKWDRNIVKDYLDDNYISVNGTLYAIKVNSFQRLISFLDLMKNDKFVYENEKILRKRFEDMLKWFYLVYLRRDVLEPLPPIIGRVKIDLLGLYKMVDSMGGYLSVSLGNKWKDVAMIHGLPEEHDEDLKECYKRTIDFVKCYYETTLRAWYKEGLVKYEETNEVEIGCDHAKEGN